MAIGSDWVDLTKPDIETILKGFENIRRLGDAFPEPSVGHPVKDRDVADALRFILERDIVGSYSSYLNTVRKTGVSGFNGEYSIPIQDRSSEGRPTPKMFFVLEAGQTGNIVRGKLLYERDDGTRYSIIRFPTIFIT